MPIANQNQNADPLKKGGARTCVCLNMQGFYHLIISIVVVEVGKEERKGEESSLTPVLVIYRLIGGSVVDPSP